MPPGVSASCTRDRESKRQAGWEEGRKEKREHNIKKELKYGWDKRKQARKETMTLTPLLLLQKAHMLFASSLSPKPRVGPMLKEVKEACRGGFAASSNTERGKRALAPRAQQKEGSIKSPDG